VWIDSAGRGSHLGRDQPIDQRSSNLSGPQKMKEPLKGGFFRGHEQASLHCGRKNKKESEGLQ